MPQSMVSVARPAVVGRIDHHPGPQRVGLDVLKDNEQVRVDLDHRALESPQPDVSQGTMALVIAPGVRQCQGLCLAMPTAPFAESK